MQAVVIPSLVMELRREKLDLQPQGKADSRPKSTARLYRHQSR